jgi:hypothetical protein
LLEPSKRTVRMQITPGGELESDGPTQVSGIATPETESASGVSSIGPTLTVESPELYFNRELSLLEFQKRVLEQAQDPENPLLERVKFFSVVSSNLDEFFMVRVAGLQRQAASLTTPTVSRDLILIVSVHEHTFPAAREPRLAGCVVSPASPRTARAVSASSIRCCPPNISSVTIDHDELCELPAERRVA